MGIHNTPDKLKRAHFPPTGRDSFIPGIGFMRAWGTTVPADGGTDYAPSCIFQKLDGSTLDTVLYINIGDKDSCNFDAAIMAS